MKRVITTIILIVVSLSAKAEVYSFDSITSYTDTGYQSVANQLTMEVVSYDTANAVLLFSNAGPVESSVAEIFFEYTGSESYSVSEPAGWSLKDTAPYLPAGNNVGFYGDFFLNASPPPSKNGILAGDSLTVAMSYLPSFNIIDALNGGALRVGLHTIGIPDTELEGKTYSESTVNTIPEAASSSLILLCSVSAFFIRRFFKL